MEPTECKYCNATEIIKAGVLHTRTVDRQLYECKVCHRRFGIRHPKDSLKSRIQKMDLLFPIPEEKQDNFSWSAYNESQLKQKKIFLEMLGNLTSFIPDDPVKVGRPNANLRDLIFCIVCKLYEKLSIRLVGSDLEDAMKKGYMSTLPHFNTVLKYFNEPKIIPILTDLIRLAAMPLKDFETTFAVDASGLSSAFYSRWLDYRFGESLIKDWIKIHIVCGVKTNIVTSIIVSDGRSNDAPKFPALIKETAEHFRIKEVCADKAYSSKENIQAAVDVGAVPYIPFKSNVTGKARGNTMWKKMHYYFLLHQEEFLARYHQRSNVEGTFSMLKRKFSTKLMCKNEIAQVVEALAMVLCHNLCVLIRELFENKINADFSEFAHLFESLNTKSNEALK